MPRVIPVEVYEKRNTMVVPYATNFIPELRLACHGEKYCKRCEIYMYHNGVFCPCCGMALRVTPTSRKDKERLRASERIT